MIDLYYWPTPNGKKITIQLEETGIPYRIKPINIGRGDRIYGVMNLGLHKKRYLAADQYTIADMICYPWATTLSNRNIDLADFPNVRRWLDEIGQRPAVQKAMAAGPEYREDPAAITPQEQARRSKLLTHQRAQPVPGEWA